MEAGSISGQLFPAETLHHGTKSSIRWKKGMNPQDPLLSVTLRSAYQIYKPCLGSTRLARRSIWLRRKRILCITGEKEIWLPFHGSLASVQAIVATTIGDEPDIKGEVPAKAKHDGKDKTDARKVSLRITAVLDLVDLAVIEELKKHPE